MKTTELPVTFECEGAHLIGIIHQPEQPKKQGILAIVAGGPQYRGGCSRQLVQMARELSANGTPVMRFDYRGLGDSSGEFEGFQHIRADINAAIDTFMENSPEVEEIILWGGCDAASAALIHGPNNPKVAGLILGNPFVHSEETHAKVVVRHYYLKRLKEKSFWLKLLKGKLNPFTTLNSVISMVKRARGKNTAGTGSSKSTANLPFPVQMLKGAQTFQGPILLLMSGLSLVSKEFDELVASSPDWSKAINRTEVDRVDFPDADQAFSTATARRDQINAAKQWIIKTWKPAS